MAKQQTPTIDDLQKELNALKVKRTLEKTDIYNERINEIENKLNYIYYGAK